MSRRRNNRRLSVAISRRSQYTRKRTDKRRSASSPPSQSRILGKGSRIAGLYCCPLTNSSTLFVWFEKIPGVPLAGRAVVNSDAPRYRCPASIPDAKNPLSPSIADATKTALCQVSPKPSMRQHARPLRRSGLHYLHLLSVHPLLSPFVACSSRRSPSRGEPLTARLAGRAGFAMFPRERQAGRNYQPVQNSRL
jgi:hypothetical protein